MVCVVGRYVEVSGWETKGGGGREGERGRRERRRSQFGGCAQEGKEGQTGFKEELPKVVGSKK